MHIQLLEASSSTSALLLSASRNPTHQTRLRSSDCIFQTVPLIPPSIPILDHLELPQPLDMTWKIHSTFLILSLIPASRLTNNKSHLKHMMIPSLNTAFCITQVNSLSKQQLSFRSRTVQLFTMIGLLSYCEEVFKTQHKKYAFLTSFHSVPKSQGVMRYYEAKRTRLSES